MSISSPGIGSGLDVNGIVSKLMAVESQPLTALATKEASFQAKVSAYGSLQGALSSFQTALQGLNDPTKFNSLTASSSNSAVVTASSSSIAVAGSYALNVSKIAQSEKLVAAGQANSSTSIGSGATTTLTFDFGTISGGALTAYNATAGTGGTYTGSTFTSNGNGTKTVTIDTTNNTLTGIRDAINNAKVGVTATIVNDGSASPYRLVLSSDNAGANNSLKVSVTGDASLSTLLAQNPAGTQNLQEATVAQNTEMTVNGLFVSKSSSTVTDVVPGVTLNALTVGTSTVSVARDTSGVTSVVNAFIKGYNDLNTTLKSLSSYDATTKTAAVLQGDYSVLSIQSQLHSLIGSQLVTGGAYTNLAYTNLTQVGIMLQKDGTLQLDSTKLQSALAANPTDVAQLFTTAGKSTDSLVSYVSSTSSTTSGTHLLNITQLATQGKLTGSAAAGLTITAGTNDTLNITVDGVNASVLLAAGTYTSASLAAEVQSKVNGASSLSNAGSSVAVTQVGGVLTLTSKSYGSNSKISIGGNAVTSLLGLAPTGSTGVDVAGTFDGIVGSATGSGQNLTGTSSGTANGIKVSVSGGAIGNRGTVSYSQGFADKLDKLITSLLGSNGPITSATDGANRSIKDIGTQRDALNVRLAATQARYLKQFTSLDTLISSMNATSTYLTQQLASLTKTTN